MAIDTDTHRTGTVRSGEVELFHRRFGRPGAAPVLILHGAGYYDSADWISVGAALAGDREVVAFDARGYGRSAWSVSHDYSLEAQLADIEAILDHLAWPEVVLLGHSRGGGFAIQYAAAHPERLAGLILADHCPGRTARGAAGSAGPPAGTPGSSVAEIFPTLADALASTSRDPNSLERPAARAPGGDLPTGRGGLPPRAARPRLPESRTGWHAAPG